MSNYKCILIHCSLVKKNITGVLVNEYIHEKLLFMSIVLINKVIGNYPHNISSSFFSEHDALFNSTVFFSLNCQVRGRNRHLCVFNYCLHFIIVTCKNLFAFLYLLSLSMSIYTPIHSPPTQYFRGERVCFNT